MSEIPVLDRSVSDWEEYITNRDNTREISGHGGGSPLGWFVTVFKLPKHLPSAEKQVIYPRIVQAILNRWTELDTIKRDDWEADPITRVADMAFAQDGVLDESLRPYYERLWKESPRPHSGTHRTIALNSQGALPVTEVELALLFELDDWSLIAALVAGKKGWTNFTLELLEKLYVGGDQVSIYGIEKAIDAGFPKLKGLRWMRLLHSDSKYGQFLIQLWEDDLLAEGITKQEIDA